MTTKVVNCKRDEYDVLIGRTTVWGNPFIIGRDGNREEVIAKFRDWFLNDPLFVDDARHELKGKILGCYCAPKACHGDVYAEICDAEELEHVTEAVNILDGRDYDVYVGNGNVKLGLEASKYGCPRERIRYGNREYKVGEYRVWLASRPRLIQLAKTQLKGKTLGASSNLGLALARVLAEIAES